MATPMWDSPVQGFAKDRLTQAVERILTKAGAPADESWSRRRGTARRNWRGLLGKQG